MAGRKSSLHLMRLKYRRIKALLTRAPDKVAKAELAILEHFHRIDRAKQQRRNHSHGLRRAMAA